MIGHGRRALTFAACAALACGDPPPVLDAALDADTAFAPGLALYWEGRYDSASVVWGAAVDRVEASGDSLGAANIRTWLGLSAMRLGDYPTARSEGEAALETKLALGGDRELARSYNALGLLAEREDRLLDALHLYEQAGAAARAVDDERMAATATGNLGLVHAYLGDLRRASTLIRQMRDGARAVEDPRLEANALTNLAMVAVWSGDPRAALEPLHSARLLYDRLESPLGQQYALAHLSAALADMGRYQEAMAVLDTAIVLSSRHGMADQEAENRRLLGSLFADLGDHRRALLQFDEAAALARRLGLDSELGTIARHSAMAHLSLGSHERAVSEAEAALEAHRRAGEPFEELDDLLVLAEIQQARADPEIVTATLGAARLVAQRLDAASARTAIALAEAGHHEATGAHRDVLLAVERARASSLDADYQAQTRIHGYAARAYAGLGELDSAAVEGLAAVRALDRVRGELASGDLRGSFSAASAQVYGDVVLILLEGGRVEEAFMVADGARSRELLQRLADSGSAEDGPQGSEDATAPEDLASAEMLLRRIAALLEQLREFEAVPPEERGSGAETTSGEILRRIERLRDQYESHVIRTARYHGRSPATSLGRATGAAHVRAALAPDEALLHYTLTRGGIVLFVARTDGFQTVTIPVTAEDLASRIRLLRALAGTRHQGADRGVPAAQGLHRLLIGPAVGTGLLDGAERLLVVPHGVMEQLPFAALHDAATGRFLIEDYIVAYAPSAGAVPALREATRPLRSLRLTSAFAPFPAALPGTVTEADAAYRAAPDGVLYRERDATEAVLRRSLSGTGVVHVASHGVLNARNPMFSHIALAPAPGGGSADDGRLEVHEVLEMDVRSPLVVLSGCETALGEDWSGNPLRPAGIATLAQAFLQAGAADVVATLWRIDDVGSAELVRRFYDGQAGEVPEALATAQREMIHHPEFGAPYYWAGYVVAGRGRKATSRPGNAMTSVH